MRTSLNARLATMLVAALTVGAPLPALADEAVPALQGASVSYSAHVQDIGWMDPVSDGEVAGTSGMSLRVEAVRIALDGIDPSEGGLEYRMHVQDVGWQDWVRDGAMGGTEGLSLRTEAFQLQLYGDVADEYDVWYRAHVQDVGWMGWTSDGGYVGSEGMSRRMEALQIRLVPDGVVPGDLEASDVTYPFISGDAAPVEEPAVVGVPPEVAQPDGILWASAHVQDIGWMDPVGNGETLGTFGSGLRVEALRLALNGLELDGGIAYRLHVQDIGWQDWSYDGEEAGTTGMSLRVEAAQIELTGEAADRYDLYYRAHVQDVGWMGWANSGDLAGTTGLGLRMEALQVAVVDKGAAVPLGPDADYPGSVIDTAAAKPAKYSATIVPELEHGYKPFAFQRCIVLHDTTEMRPFDEWIDLWKARGGEGVHFMVAEDGSIRQYARLEQMCWHAGGAAYPALNDVYGVVAYNPDGGSPMNQCSIGIEIEHIEDGRPYPEAQLDGIDELIAYLDAYYGFPCTILQHKEYQDISPDCSEEFQGYLANLQATRRTRS